MRRNTDMQNAVRNLQLRQTMLTEKAEYIRANYGIQHIDEAFEALVTGLLFDIDFDAIEPEEKVGGAQEKQIDIIRIEDDEEQNFAHIHIIQTKNHTRGFSSNTLIKMRSGLGWLFDIPAADYTKLSNERLVNKIGEIRHLRQEYGCSNLSVSVYLVTKGDAQRLSDEFLQERKVLVDTYSNVGFRQFDFRELGAFELVELLNESERSGRKIDADIGIVYDVNKRSLIEYVAGDTKAVICTASGKELARVASLPPRDAIFDLNVRPFYGARGRVNADIQATCMSPEESSRFWFLNNGVTMICDRFDIVGDPDTARVKAFNLQIVNGCQTAVTLREAEERGELREDVHILLRIYATDSLSLTERITLTTNNQNRITDRDLRANDDVQRDIQRIMLERFGFHYERKNKEYRKLQGPKRKRILPNYKVAQAYLAIVRKKPSVARGYLGKIWAEHYEEIFGNATVEDLLASYLIYKVCADRARSLPDPVTTEVRIENDVKVYGTFHLARIVGYLATQDSWGTSNREAISDIIAAIQADESWLAPHYERALGVLLGIWETSLADNPNPTLFFKANEVQRQISRAIGNLS